MCVCMCVCVLWGTEGYHRVPSKFIKLEKFLIEFIAGNTKEINMLMMPTFYFHWLFKFVIELDQLYTTMFANE